MKRIDNLCQSNAFPGLVEVRPPRKPILLLIPRPCILRGIRWHAQPFLFGCTWNSLTCSAIFVRLHFKSESKWRMQFLCTWVDRTSGCLRWRAYSFSLKIYMISLVKKNINMNKLRHLESQNHSAILNWLRYLHQDSDER